MHTKVDAELALGRLGRGVPVQRTTIRISIFVYMYLHVCMYMYINVYTTYT